MRRTLVPLLAILILVPLPAGAAPKARRPGAATSAPVARADIDWRSFPPPDTTELMQAQSAPGTDNAVAELLLDDSGVNFGTDGSIAAVTCKVFLLKSRAAGTTFAKLPASPVGPENSTVAFVVHATGQREAALSTRDGVARFGALYPGDRLVLINRIVERPTTPGMRPGRSVVNAMRTEYPILRSRFWVRYPTARPPGARALNLGEPVVESQGAYTLKSWRAEHQPAAPREPGAQNLLDEAPAVFVDSRADVDWLEGLCRGWLKLPAGSRLKGLARQLRAQSVDRGTLLAHAREFVAGQIQPRPDEDISPEALRRLTPDAVLQRGSAGPFGRTVLLVGLLRQLGFDPAIALVEPQRLWRRPPALNPGTATPVVALPSDKPVMWLNPQSAAHSTRRPDLAVQGQTAVVVGPLRTLPSVSIPVSAGAARGTNAELTGVLDPSGIITGTMKVSFLGDDADLWRAMLRPVSNKDAFEMMSRISFQMLFNSEPQDINGENFDQLGDEVALVSKVRARDLMERRDNICSLRLPTRIVPDLDPGPRLTARSLLRIYGTCNERIELELPPGWSPVEGRDSSSAQGRYLRWNETRTVVGGKFVLNREVAVLQAELPAADYDAFLKEQAARNFAFDRPVEFRAAP